MLKDEEENKDGWETVGKRPPRQQPHKVCFLRLSLSNIKKAPTDIGSIFIMGGQQNCQKVWS